MTLLAPLFLAGLLAIALPWWLHRLNLDQPPERSFASTMLLEPADSLSSQETRLRFRPLLLLRTLFIALLALLFAQPVLDRLSAALSTESSALQLLVVDTSFSQNHGERWSNTVQLATAIIDNTTADDSIQVIAAAARFTQQPGDGSASAARSAISRLTPGMERLDFGRIGNAVAAIIADSTLPVDVHVISDLQVSAIPDRFSDLHIDNANSLTLHNSAGSDDQNLSVSGQLDSIRNQIARITAVVNNNGELARSVDLSLLNQQQTLASVRLDLNPNDSVTHQFIDVDTSDANGQLELQLQQSDPLPQDNRTLIALPAATRTELSVVGASQNSLAQVYIQAALESDPRFAANLLRPTAIAASTAGSLLLVPDAAVLSDSDTGRLQEYLQSGGNVFLATGARAHSVRMRRLLNEAPSAPGAKPATGQPLSVADIDSTHPLVASLERHWRELSIGKRSKLLAAQTDRVIATVSDGSPLLLERSIGSGKLIVLASALDSNWNNLAVSPVFVAFTLRTIEYLSDDFAVDPQRSIGEVLNVSAGSQVLDPDGNALRDFSGLDERAAVELVKPGLYTIENALGARFLAVGPDVRESDIDTIDDTTASKWQAAGSAAVSGADSPAAGLANAPLADPANHHSLHRWLLPLLALLALAEALFSHRHLWIRREA